MIVLQIDTVSVSWIPACAGMTKGTFFGVVSRFVGKRLSGKKAFIALGLTAGNKTAGIHRRRTRAAVLVADKALNAIGRSGTEHVMPQLELDISWNFLTLCDF